jgi:AraC-like DNA-binding protein
LVESDSPVGMIAYEVGLANLANFNRHFRRLRNMTPTAYRESAKQHGRLVDTPSGADPQSLSERPKSLDGRRKLRPFKAPKR